MDQIPQYKDEMDWRDLLRKPESLFGYSYFYALVVLVGVGLLYLAHLNTVGRNLVTPSVLQDSIGLVKDLPLQSPRIIPPVDVMKAAVSTPEMINKGRDLFKANCASCHGDNGQGDGPSASMLNPKPRNFHSLERWKNGSTITQMYKTLQEGIPGGGMASFNYMPPNDRFALIHYIRAFAGQQPQNSQDELKQLDAAYQLAKGTNAPGQIPIKKALQVVVKENVSSVEAINDARKHLAASNAAGADLLRRVSYDEQKVLTSALHMLPAIKNVDEFIRSVSSNPIRIGFKVNVIRLSGSEWIELYHYIYSIVK